MFDLGWPELFVIVLVALVVLGPKELPGAIRTVTGLVRRARGLAREFHKSIDEMAKESGLDEVKRDLQKATRAELDDDGAFSDPFSEADRNSILNPTADKKLAKPNGTTTDPAKPATADSTEPAVEASPPADTPTPEAEPIPVAETAKESGRA